MESQERIHLSKALTRVLRHKPWLFELELDDQGWTAVEPVLQGLRQSHAGWTALDLSDLQEVVATSPKSRFEMRGGQIRALYGHSTPQRIAKTPAQPPDVLYHGTPGETLPVIRETGLKPMSRQYVHMTTDKRVAVEVGKRKGGTTVMLVISAEQAHLSGIVFYRGNDFVWLADHVPPQFIQFPE